MINKDGGGAIFRFYGGGHNCYDGGHRAHGGSLHSPPPLGKTLGSHVNIEFTASARENEETTNGVNQSSSDSKV